MADVNALVTQLNALGISTAPVEHAPVENNEQWTEALKTVSGLPSSYVLTKTLVFKPKQPKSDPIAPIMVVIKETTAANAKAIGAELKFKDLRLANEDVLRDIFQTAKGSVSPFALGQVAQGHIGNVRVVLDKALLNDGVKIGFHPLNSSRTVFIDSASLKKYISSIDGLEHVVEMDFTAVAAPAAPESKASKKPAAAATKPEEPVGMTKPGMQTRKSENFSKWYQEVVLESEMLSHYNVSGCYILRPRSHFVWEQIQEFFGAGIKAMGVRNCYFPMFVSSQVLEREKDHIEGFAPEVAWVTKAGSKDLNEHLAIRPTSETVMYPYFGDWIRSHRDLPLRLNQWCSVVRWEFKNPQPFLRTREFLWQEGHCAYFNKEQAMDEARAILTLYRRVYEELLAVPVIEGEKSEKEKFAGGVTTTTVEGFIPETGRGIQGGTSHYLGQNFSKMFNVVVEDPSPSAGAERPKLFVHQTSWGLSTRTIGVMVMLHSDDKGLVLPPRVAETQVVIIPCGLQAKTTDAERSRVNDACLTVEARLRKAGIRVETDLRDIYTPGFKFNHWELRGVPLRLEIGPKDISKDQVTVVRRDNSARESVAMSNMEDSISLMMIAMQNEMLAKARKTMDERVKMVLKWEDFVPTLNSKCLALIPWCEREECEEQIKNRSTRDVMADEPEDEREPSMGAKSLCLPYAQPQDPPIVQGETKCVQCGQNALRYALFGRSY
ncbi:hypothetical protein IWW36_000390 [Coemansia brasiliensis]|uniref:proline--tRNA ligase n=1 Tax=Coemansia brasiliensis TaxID=2650707 RepID=A0A9W8IDH0_9FUNG|nr:hypothetical protein IWW36_000390 [Coemansia brasiliensis]